MIKQLSAIFKDKQLNQYAHKHGLVINSTSWEDTARTKNSCYGPNISDMTLVVNDFDKMPMIRKPNYQDITTDMKAESFLLPIGNENDTPLKRISLKQYLENASEYLSNPLAENLYCKERDEAILTSAQFCIVPENENFTVQLFNYQSHYGDPAVLVILMSQDGTSAQCVVERNQKIYFNKNGRSFDFSAKRLSEDRKERKVEDLTAKMTKDEQEKNALFIFQVPLKQQHKYRGYVSGSSFACNMQPAGCAPPPYVQELCSYQEPEPEEEVCDLSFELFEEVNERHVEKKIKHKGIEHAILALGNDKGKFSNYENYKLQRDPQYPIRCTIQFYQVTDTLAIKEEQFQFFNEKINSIYKSGEAMGSLVVDRDQGRKTEFVQGPLFSMFDSNDSSSM